MGPRQTQNRSKTDHKKFNLCGVKEDKPGNIISGKIWIELGKIKNPGWTYPHDILVGL